MCFNLFYSNDICLYRGYFEQHKVSVIIVLVRRHKMMPFNQEF